MPRPSEAAKPDAAEALALLKTEGLQIYLGLSGDSESLGRSTIESLFKLTKDNPAKLLNALREARTEPPCSPVELRARLARSLEPPKPECPALLKPPARNPMQSDPPNLWADYAEKWEVDREMVKRPCFAGCYVDVISRIVCEAAGIADPKYRGDWLVIIKWLRDGLDQQDFLAVIRQVAGRPNYRPPKSLAYFDAAVREVRQ